MPRRVSLMTALMCGPAPEVMVGPEPLYIIAAMSRICNARGYCGCKCFAGVGRTNTGAFKTARDCINLGSKNETPGSIWERERQSSDVTGEHPWFGVGGSGCDV